MSTKEAGQMMLSITETEGEVILKIKGDFDLTTVPEFRKAAGEALEMRAGRRLVIELSETDYIDSAGLEQLLIINKKLMEAQDRLLVRGKSKTQPRTVLSVAGFDTVMDVEP